MSSVLWLGQRVTAGERGCEIEGTVVELEVPLVNTPSGVVVRYDRPGNWTVDLDVGYPYSQVRPL